MSENSIPISNLNDFIFCPVSIYFHSLDYDTERLSYQATDQINGAASHTASDNATYSTEKSMLQGIAVYSEQYDLYGKIDTFDVKRGVLRERKKK